MTHHLDSNFDLNYDHFNERKNGPRDDGTGFFKFPDTRPFSNWIEIKL